MFPMKFYCASYIEYRLWSVITQTKKETIYANNFFFFVDKFQLRSLGQFKLLNDENELILLTTIFCRFVEIVE